SVRIVGTDGKTRSVPPVRVSHGKAAEFQARGAIHFHALIRLDGINPDHPAAIVPPPNGIGARDLEDAIRTTVAHIRFTSRPHPDTSGGWRIAWGQQVDIRQISVTGRGEVSDRMVAGYLAKYATKSTEATGHTSARITTENLAAHLHDDGHIARLIGACWR